MQGIPGKVSSSVFYWLLKHVIVGPLMRVIWRPWVTGLENVPKEGPVILAGNHLSVIDSFFMPLMAERRVFFLAKQDYFIGRGFSGWFVKNFMLATGQLPIDRGGGKGSEASLNTGLEVLGRGDVLGIYPEGTRSPDGRLYRGRTGIARMIIESGATVVPVIMIGSERAMPIGAKVPKIRRIGTVFGEPLDFTRFHGLGDDRIVLRSITDEIMHSLRALSGQEYIDVYASTVRSRSAASAR